MLRLRLDTFDRPLTAPILRLLDDSGNPDIPGSTVLSTFSTPTLVGGINNFTFTPTGLFTLLADEKYWLDLSSAADFDTSGLNWLASNPPVTPTGVATLSGNRFTSDGGAIWVGSTTVNSLTINGTVVPEGTVTRTCEHRTPRDRSGRVWVLLAQTAIEKGPPNQTPLRFEPGAGRFQSSR